MWFGSRWPATLLADAWRAWRPELHSPLKRLEELLEHNLVRIGLVKDNAGARGVPNLVLDIEGVRWRTLPIDPG